MTRFTLFYLFACLIFSEKTHAQCLGNNLWFNGDFEDPNADELASGWNPACFPLNSVYPTFTTALPNGAYTYFDYDHTIGPGGHFLWMDYSLTNCGSIFNSPLLTRTISTVPGQAYRFSLWTFVFCTGIGGSFGMEVDGNLLLTVDLLALANGINGPCQPGWMEYSVEFTATSNQTVFSVVNINWSSFGWDFAFDDVAIQTIQADWPLDVSPDAVICQGDSTTISALGPSGTTYEWSPATGLSDPNIASPQALPTSTTTYTVTATDAFGCTNTGAVTVTVATGNWNLGVSPSDTICLGECATIAAQGPPGAAYTWSPTIGLSDPNIAIPQACPTATTTYTVTATDAFGCTNTGAVTVTTSTLNLGVSQGVTICEGDCTNIAALGPAGTFYAWSPALGLSDAFVASPQACPTATTTYTVTAINSEGCTASNSVTVAVNVPSMTVSPAGIICPGSCTVITANMANTVSYAWSPNTGLDNPAMASPQACPTTTTTYTVTATDAFNCTVTGQVTITVDATPDIGLPDSVFVCEGDCALLQPTISGTFLWENGSTDAVRNVCPNSPELYTLELVGCASSDSTWVVPLPLPVPNLPDSIGLCPGACQTLDGGDWSAYLWSNGSTEPTLYACLDDFPLGVLLTVTDENGCEGSNSTVLFPAENTLQVALESPVFLELGDGTRLSPQLNIAPWQLDSLHWAPPIGIDCDTCLSPYASPVTTTEYLLQIFDLNGCSAQAPVTIIVRPTIQVYAPNVFHPDGVSGNDRFTLFTKPGTVSSILLLQVFDRWGELVFDQKNFPPSDVGYGWDGNFRNQPMDAQVCAWLANVLLVNGQELLLKGDFMLLR